MIEMIRRCPDCGQDHPFERHHPQGSCCPEDAGGHCPEWSCADCGAALLIGFIPRQREATRAKRPRRLVA